MEYSEINFKNICDNLYEGMYVLDTERKIIYWNKRAEEITGYLREEMIGKNCHENIAHLDSEGNSLCLGLCPSAFVLAHESVHEAKLYLQHKDGHRIPIITRVSPLFDSESGISGVVELFSDNTEFMNVRYRMRELARLALADTLTGIGNRRYAENIVHSRIEEFRRYGWKFGVAFIDIDDFKKVNDTYGHETGDKALKMVARSLLGNIRTSDFLGRWGGEEFLAIFINVGDEESLFRLTDKLRLLVEKSTLERSGENIKTTISAGAALVREGDSADSLISRADDLMYQSKKEGKNRTSI